jgi:hypothetical protein
VAIELDIDTKALSDTVNRMIAQVDHFKRVDIGTGLSDFQVQDMHRHRPFTMRSRAKGLAITKIRPHSLFEVERSAQAAARLARYRRALARAAAQRAFGKRVRKYRRRHTTQRLYRHWSTRDILRAEMIAVLTDRMVNLIHTKITWTAAKRGK